MSEDKKIDPSHWSASTGEQEEFVERIKNLDLERKRGSGASGDSDGLTSNAVTEEATPTIATSAKSLQLLSSSASAAHMRRSARRDKEELESAAEAATTKSEDEEGAPVSMGTGAQPGAAAKESRETDKDTGKANIDLAVVIKSGDDARVARKGRDAILDAKEADEE